MATERRGIKYCGKLLCKIKQLIGRLYSLSPHKNTAMEQFQPLSQGQVSTIHILKSGEIISTLEEFREVEDRFGWVNKVDLVTKLLQLRRLTDNTKKSVIAIYEDGQVVREYVNVEYEFRPLSYY